MSDAHHINARRQALKQTCKRIRSSAAPCFRLFCLCINTQLARGCRRAGRFSRRAWRGKTNSSLGGRKAHLNFEVKERARRRRQRFEIGPARFRSLMPISATAEMGAPSLTSKFRYAPVSRAMNEKVWPGLAFSIGKFARFKETAKSLAAMSRVPVRTVHPCDYHNSCLGGQYETSDC